MKRFEDENIAHASRVLALAVVEVSVAVTHLVRAEVRARLPRGLSFTQLRALGALSRQPEASLSELADHLGLGMPTTSKLVEDLVTRRLVRRAGAPLDRRRLALRLTPAGAAALAEAWEIAGTRVAALLAPLPRARKVRLAAAVAGLGEILGAQASRRALARPQRRARPPAAGSRGRRR